MDRLKQLNVETNESRDLTLDTSSPPSESFITANESSSKFYSLSEVDSTFGVSPTKDSSATTEKPDVTISESDLISNLSPIPKKIDNFKIGKQIEAANILSGGVNIFDDNENSYDGDELVIDDNNLVDDEKYTSAKSQDLELPSEKCDATSPDAVADAIPSKDTEVVLQIDGKNVDAIAIGNGLYLYRKTGLEELAAVQIIDDDQLEPSFKFLKVRENSEGNLEVYEEIEIEVPKEMPAKEGKPNDKKTHMPINDISKVIIDTDNKCIDEIPQKIDNSESDLTSDINTDLQSDFKAEVNLNGKKVMLNESRKSPLTSTFTSMTIHSTPNKEGVPLTKTMVDQQLHPSRHVSDNIKKTIEVHTDKKETVLKPKEMEISRDYELETCIGKENFKDNHEISHCDIRNSNVNIEENKNTQEEVVNNDSINDVKDLQIIPTDVSNNSEKNNDESSSDLCHSKCHEQEQDNQETKDEESLFGNADDGNQAETKKALHNDNKIQIIPQKITILCTTQENLSSNEDSHDFAQDSSKSKDVQTIIDIPAQVIINNTDKEIISTPNNIKSDITNEKDVCVLSPIVVSDTNEYKQIKKDDHLSSTEKQIISPILPDESKKEVETIVNDGFDSNNDLSRLTPSGCRHPTESIKVLESTYFKTTPNLLPEQTKLSSSNIKKETEIKNDSDMCSDSDKKKPVAANTKENCHTSNEILPESSKALKQDDTSADDKTDTPKSNLLSEKKTIGENCFLVNNDKKNKEPVISQQVVTEVKIPVAPSIIKGEASSNKMTETKPSNNNAAVPFGKWTEANRQEFLNKIKETKIPCSNSNTKQLKQPNDLNRRDVLKKIDTQRQAHQTAFKNNDFGASLKTEAKTNTNPVFVKKPVCSQRLIDQDDEDIVETKSYKNVSVDKNTTKKLSKDEIMCKDKDETLKKVPAQRKEINNQDLIDKTIEGIINRAVSTKPHEEWKQTIKMDAAETLKSHNSIVSLDGIEKKMNELHGIPFVERPAHELPKVHIDNKTSKTNVSNISNIPQPCYKNKLEQKSSSENVMENISDEEIIEHEPVTGDMNLNDLKISVQKSVEKLSYEKATINANDSKNEPVITENEFDKFARRNSMTFENCVTVNFDGKESQSVIQTLVEKEVPSKKLTRNEIMLAESKAKSTNKLLLMRHNTNPNKVSMYGKNVNEDDTFNKNYQPQSKVQLAYQSALTAKRQLECPLTIIEDKPVKVVFLDSASEPLPANLNMQSQEVSLTHKKPFIDIDSQSASESVDSDIIDATYESKSCDENKSKNKHPRKQVLTPVHSSDLELIEPSEIITESPKKKRRLEEAKNNSTKKIAPKKSYLLNRGIVDKSCQKLNTENIICPVNHNPVSGEDYVPHTISAIDNLVKAAELIETQSENKKNNTNSQTSESLLTSPIKRGRGRPRKYPLPESSPTTLARPYSQKELSKLPKEVVDSDYSDMDDEFIKENWTMGKINENIVCPICNKLFRSENVVFKHVKHCTGPSPNRSDSDRRSLKRLSQSGGKLYDSDSDTSDDSENENIKVTKEINETTPISRNEDMPVIKDTPEKVKPLKEKVRQPESIKTNSKNKLTHENLVCEFCSKTFRQLSYLVNHKLQHKRENLKKPLSTESTATKSMLCCEICNKEFRKLHHLVQHRIIHNSNSMSSRLLRKSSNEKTELNALKDTKMIKHKEDQSAGFRCEPCDKSFRKLHHLVEHRETHDGINKKSSSTNNQSVGEGAKVNFQHICKICKKTFRKLQHLMEHKEQHLDSSSEKSDDKSVKSSLSTRDIIHECSLCYMVFPNEHSLNKHTIACLRKKKQSAARKAKLLEKKGKDGEGIIDCEAKLSEDEIHNISDKDDDIETLIEEDDEEASAVIKVEQNIEDKKELSQEVILSENKIELDNTKKVEGVDSSNEVEILQNKRSFTEEENTVEKSIENIGKKNSKIRKIEVITIADTPTSDINLSKTKAKDDGVLSKRYRIDKVQATLTVKSKKNSTHSSDDDEIRYMLNPNFKDNIKEKFMKVRANKRNSLQFERPNSKNLIKRRISLQNCPRVQRGKTKPTECKPLKTAGDKRLNDSKKQLYTDSDDSDVKYSFPKTNIETVLKGKVNTVKRQSVATGRKSVTPIAKRKSIEKQKLPTLIQKSKRRTIEPEHRCDCGQLFSSAALLTRHTTLAHTPPRVRRRREPPPTHSAPDHIPPPAHGHSQKVASVPQPIRKNSDATSKTLTSIKTSRNLRACSSESKMFSAKAVSNETNMKRLRSATQKRVSDSAKTTK